MSAIARYPGGDPTAVLRLEIEEPSTGLINRVENPSGDLGAWGWITPRPGQRLDARPWLPIGTALHFYSTAAADNFVQTVPMPVTPGKYVAAAWDTLFVDANGRYRARLTFRSASGAVVTSSPWVTGTTTGRTSIPAVQVPATAVDVSFVLEMGNGGTFPLTHGGYLIVFRDVTVAMADTAGAFGIARTNLFADNPAFDAALSNRWQPMLGCTIARSGTAGNYMLAVTATTVGANRDRMLIGWDGGAAPIALTPGDDYTLSLDVLASNGAGLREVRATLRYADGSAQLFGRIGEDQAGGQVTRLARTFTAASASLTRLELAWQGPIGVGEAHFLGRIMIEKGTQANPFIVGTQTSSALENVVPVTYRNVIGPAVNITVNRDELDVGVMTAEVVSAALDPATSDLIRPNRRARLLALAGGVWEPLIVGKADDAKVTYDPLDPDPERRARITMTVVDNVAPLARTPQAESVGRVADLPYLLEGAGVPWDVDGSANTVASATVVAVSDGASVVDQVALVRDSAQGYAWVDRFGVLRVRSGLPTLNAALIPVVGKMDSAADWTTLPHTAKSLVPGQTGNALNLAVAEPTLQMIATYGLLPAQVIAAYPGQAYRVEWTTRAATTSRPTLAALAWLDANGVVISDHTSDWEAYLPNGTASWQTFTREYVAPPGAVRAAVVLAVLASDFDPDTETGTALPVGEQHRFDNVSVRPVAGTRALDDTVYNPNIAVDFDMSRCINVVTVKVRAIDAAGETQETVYGPFSDAGSVAQWGPRPAEFTVTGIAPQDVPAWAQRVLSRNARPARTVTSLTVPIDYDGGADLVALDLYDAVRVTNAEADVDAVLRTAAVSHRITGEGHLMDLRFTAENTIAPPQLVPPLTSGPAPAGVPRLDMVKNANVHNVDNATWATIGGWVVEAMVGLTANGSEVTVEVPGTYLVAGAVTFAPHNTASRRLVRLRKNATSVLEAELPSTVSGSGARVTVPVPGVPVSLARGDVIAMQAYQNSGVTLAVQPNSNTYMRMYRIGD